MRWKHYEKTFTLVGSNEGPWNMKWTRAVSPNHKESHTKNNNEPLIPIFECPRYNYYYYLSSLLKWSSYFLPFPHTIESNSEKSRVLSLCRKISADPMHFDLMLWSEWLHFMLSSLVISLSVTTLLLFCSRGMLGMKWRPECVSPSFGFHYMCSSFLLPLIAEGESISFLGSWKSALWWMVLGRRCKRVPWF